MGGNKLPVNVNDVQRKTFFRNLAIVIIVFVVFFTLPNLCGAHGDHDHHGHSHDEPASFKYSKQANEELLKEEHHHTHDDHHGHHHEGHDHSHGGHHGHQHAETKSKDIPLGLFCHTENVEQFSKLLFAYPFRYGQHMVAFDPINVAN